MDVGGHAWNPITTSISADIRTRRLEKYLARRDEYRAERGDPPVWAGTKVAFAARQYQLKDNPRGELARRVRVIWDKGWHGGNKAKGGCTEEEAECVMCGLPNGQKKKIYVYFTNVPRGKPNYRRQFG